MSDQQQAQVPVAVEGASEPHEELANSTSGAAYELETSGDGEARQMAASNDDTADLGRTLGTIIGQIARARLRG